MRHYTVFLSEDSSDDEFQQEEDPVSAFSESFFFSAPFEWPQPYRALKESDSADGEEVVGLGKPKDAAPANPPAPDEGTDISLLEDIFTNLEVESQPQPLSQAKSLEDLRTPKEEGAQPCTFDYQRMDLGVSEWSRIVPAMKLSHPYNKLWSMGHDDMAIPTKYSQSSPERPLTPLGNAPLVPRRPWSRDSILTPTEKEEVNSPSSQGNITIPRPQGRKTPELGIVPPPPASRPAKQQLLAEPANAQAGGPGSLGSELLRDVAPEQGFRVSLNYPPHSSQLRSNPGSTTEMLQPVKVNTEGTANESDLLLSLLDPLKTHSWQSPSSRQGPGSLHGSVSPSLASMASDFAPPLPAPFSKPLGYLPSAPPFVQPSLNPFAQATPTAGMPMALARPPGGPFASPSMGHAYSSSFLASNSGLSQPQRPQPNIVTLSMPNLLGHAPAAQQASSLLQQSPSSSKTGSLQPSKIRTLPMAHSASKIGVKPQLPPRPAKALELALLPSKPEETKDPFEDLLKKTKQEVSDAPGKVEQLRKRWETFE
uniref:DENN domain-containing protein 1A n=1 Tax=Sphenodon punctatus TaxID=8508 RepID=A0A8D0G131_SPHPU